MNTFINLILPNNTKHVMEASDLRNNFPSPTVLAVGETFTYNLKRYIITEVVIVCNHDVDINVQVKEF